MASSDERDFSFSATNSTAFPYQTLKCPICKKPNDSTNSQAACETCTSKAISQFALQMTERHAAEKEKERREEEKRQAEKDREDMLKNPTYEIALRDGPGKYINEYIVKGYYDQKTNVHRVAFFPKPEESESESESESGYEGGRNDNQYGLGVTYL